MMSQFGVHERESGSAHRSVTWGRCCMLAAALLIAEQRPAAAYRAYIPNANDGTVSVINTNAKKVVRTLTKGSADRSFGRGVAVSPGGRRVYVGDRSIIGVDIIDARKNKTIATVPLPLPGFTYALALNLDGTRLYAADAAADALCAVDVTTTPPSVLATLTLSAGGGYTTGVAVSPAGARVYVSGEFDQLVQVIDTDTNTVVASVPTPGQPRGLAISPDGARVYVAQWDPNILVIDTATNTIATTISVLGFAHCSDYCNLIGIAFSPDGIRAYASSNSEDVYLIDTVNNRAVLSVDAVSIDDGSPWVFRSARGLSLTPDGKWLYVADALNSVWVVDTATNIIRKPISVGLNPNSLGQFIDPAPYSIKGRALDVVGGPPSPPPAEAPATLTLVGPGGRTLTTTTGKKGRFQFDNLPAGMYTITGSDEGCTFGPQSVYLHGRSAAVRLLGSC